MKRGLTLVRAAKTTIALGMAMAVLAGCGGGANEEKVIASAGDMKVTLADFNDAYNRITPNNRPDISTLEAKRRFALGLLDKEILLDEGKRLGGITDPKILNQIALNFRNVLASALYREEVEAKTEVLGRDVADLYEQRKFNVKLSHILLPDVETARRVRDEITAKKISFADAAKKYSLDQMTKNEGGAVGEIIWSRAMPEYQKYAFTLEPGTISEPFEGEYGVHLVLVHERLPQELPPLEDLRVSLRSDVRRQKETERMRTFLVELEAKANLTWHEEGLAALEQCIDAMLKQDIDTIPREEQYIPQPTEEQRRVPLASFGGRDWTIGDYTDALAMQPLPNRPVSRMPQRALKEMIRTTQIDAQLIYEEALARGLDKDPEVVMQDKRMREHILLELVHGRFLQDVDVTEDDARAVYDSVLAASPSALEIPERVDMLVLISTKEDVVREGLRRIRSGEPEGAVIQELSEDFRTKYRSGRTGLIPRANYAPQLEDVAFDPARVGKGWSEPIVTESSTGAVKVLAHEEPRVSTFEEQKQLLMNRLVQARGEAAFEEWMQARRDSLGVEIHDEVLELIGQPVS
jgi:parvulin-like peptidyl-prolyl isomerase